jgi:hypothetical protein
MHLPPAVAPLAVLALVLLVPASAADPPLALHPDNPRYFLFRGKPTVVVTSGEHYGAVLNLDFDFAIYLDTLDKAGLNGTRTWVGTYVETAGNFNIASNTLDPTPGRFICPWARSDQSGYADGGNKFDLTRRDEAYFRRLREFLAHAGRRGVIVELNIFCPLYEDSMWSVSPMNPRNNVNGLGPAGRNDAMTLDRSAGLLPVQEAVARQVLEAALPFDNVYLEVCNEPYDGRVPDDWQRHMAGVLAAAQESSPRKLLLSQNIANGAARAENLHPAISIINFHYAAPPDAIALNAGFRGVIGDNETGFRGTADLPYRTEAWDFILAGGGLFNHLDYSFTVKHPDGSWTDYPATQPGGGNPTLRRQFGILSRFVHSFDFIRMKPDTSCVKGGVPAGGSVRAMVEPGRAWAIYLRRGMGGGAFSARWTGFIVPGFTGATLIETVSNDGVRLEVDGKRVIDNWTDHAETTDRAQVMLTAGTQHAIKLEYFYTAGEGTMRLLWTPPGGKREPIPAAALRQPDKGEPGLRGEYFRGPGLKEPWRERRDQTVDFKWGTKPPFAVEATAGAATLEVDLPAGSYAVEWLDVLTGDVVRPETLQHAGGSAKLESPVFASDIALAIRRR